jgi:precorrin-3B synthase
VHQAADGGLARVRVPGGTLTNAQFSALTSASAELGDGGLELTSRANIQIRGLAAGAEVELASRLWEAGLLPSLSHERVRNIISSPLSDHQHLVDALDRAICAVPSLAGLPGRFLVTVDDGRGDVSGLAGDVGLHGDALLLAGQDTGLRVSDPVAAVVSVAEAFQAIRGDAWRMAEVPDGVRQITAKVAEGEGFAEIRQLAADSPRWSLTPQPDHLLDIPLPVPASLGPAGNLIVVGVPLGRITAAQAAVLCDLGPWVRLTPWRSVVVPAPADLAGTGLVTDPASPWQGVTACTGRPGCAKSLADVRADAAEWVKTRSGTKPVHWSGCARRCGRPAGHVVEMIAIEDGYRRIE